jgi:hypothetical protein
MSRPNSRPFIPPEDKEYEDDKELQALQTDPATESAATIAGAVTAGVSTASSSASRGTSRPVSPTLSGSSLVSLEISSVFPSSVFAPSSGGSMGTTNPFGLGQILGSVQPMYTSGAGNPFVPARTRRESVVGVSAAALLWTNHEHARKASKLSDHATFHDCMTMFPVSMVVQACWIDRFRSRTRK